MGSNKGGFILRRLPLYIGLTGGFGGILPDFDHLYRIVLNPEYSSYYLHHYGWMAAAVFSVGSIIAFGGRPAAALVLRALCSLRRLIWSPDYVVRTELENEMNELA